LCFIGCKLIELKSLGCSIRNLIFLSNWPVTNTMKILIPYWILSLLSCNYQTDGDEKTTRSFQEQLEHAFTPCDKLEILKKTDSLNSKQIESAVKYFVKKTNIQANWNGTFVGLIYPDSSTFNEGYRQMAQGFELWLSNFSPTAHFSSTFDHLSRHMKKLFLLDGYAPKFRKYCFID